MVLILKGSFTTTIYASGRVVSTRLIQADYIRTGIGGTYTSIAAMTTRNGGLQSNHIPDSAMLSLPDLVLRRQREV